MKTNLFTAAVVLLFLFNACTEDDVSDVKYNEMSLAAFMDSGQDNYPDNYPDNYRENYNDYEENPFIKVSDQPVSTFSVDADGGSYANMRRFLYLGQTPPKASVRIEEYLNYFTFDYAEPQNGENVSLNSELSSCPWNTEHYLMRLGMKGKTIPENELPNSNYVFLIDVSGSMNSPEKLGILKSGFKTMTDNLKDQDRIAIVTYAGEAGVLLPSTYCDEKEKLKQQSINLALVVQQQVQQE
nr:von Willebrand factor type A domain-containing protein [Draconibacterium orientale]